jgi:hypothetical protein
MSERSEGHAALGTLGTAVRQAHDDTETIAPLKPFTDHRLA